MENAELKVIRFGENDVIATSVFICSADHSSSSDGGTLHMQIVGESGGDYLLNVYSRESDGTLNLDDENSCEDKGNFSHIPGVGIGTWIVLDGDGNYISSNCTQ